MVQHRAWADRFSTPKPIIGMLHLPPLPGAPRYHSTLADIESFCLKDADALIKGGCHGLLLENFGDSPFYPDRVPTYVSTIMTRLALKIKQRYGFPLGINVLRNDAESALAIAVASGADFIRVNILSGSRVTDQGVITGQAHTLLRERRLLQADHIAVIGDVAVKHSAPLAPRGLKEETQEMVERGGADAVIVSGLATGMEVDLKALEQVRSGSRKHPVLIGSGVTSQNISTLSRVADGFIIGTGFKHGGKIFGAVERERVRAVADALRQSSTQMS